MTIKDIARLANVSVSTVSKVLNDKDENISEETRRRVQEIVREYQFVPYRNVREKLKESPGAVALVVPDIKDFFFSSLISALEKEARAQGFSLMLCNSENDEQMEEKHMNVLSQKRLDGAIVYPMNGRSLRLLAEAKVPFVSARCSESSRYSTWFDFSKAAGLASAHLVDNMHRKIGFVSSGEPTQSPFFPGYKNALFQEGIQYEERYVTKIYNPANAATRLIRLFDMGVTALLCADTAAAALVYQYARKRKISIPEDLSVVLLGDIASPSSFLPDLTHMAYPFQEFAHAAFQQLQALICKASGAPRSNAFTPVLVKCGSSNVPYGSQGKRIIIVGDLSADITLSIPSLPVQGGVVTAWQKNASVGGKAANQAICASQLGGNVSVIGRLGDDKEGKVIYETLSENRISTEGVYFDKHNSTGCAYLSVTPSGEGSVVVYGGANNAIDIEQIHSHLDLFEGAEFCSCHTALPTKALLYIHAICQEKQVKMILKPNPDLPREGTEALLDGLFLLIPNEHEMNILCPWEDSLEDRMLYFKKKGVQHVLVTLGEKGCAFLEEKGMRMYPAEKVSAVDTSGASDCFISSLLVCLANGQSFEQAIPYANYAAGLSVTRQGNFSSMAYKSMLDARFNVSY